ncbi:MAG: STAS domain-containing protein, partial [Clostridiales bacterium]|nr:STAS domain-containing protein [Clostridiales bacterium]
TVALDLTYAILIGVALSMIMTINMLAKVHVNIEEETLLDNVNAAIVYSVGAYFFANGKELKKAIEKETKRYDTYILSFRGVVSVDLSAETEFLEAIEYIKSIGADFCFVGLNEYIFKDLEKIGFQEQVGIEHFYPNLEDYVKTISEKA